MKIPLCAGAYVDELLKYPDFVINCDSSTASRDIWNVAKINLIKYMDKALHRHRLKRLGLDDIIEYSFSLNTANVIPKLVDNELVNINAKIASR